MHKGRKASKRIFASLLAATLVMSTLEGSAFSVSAAQLETEVAEGQTAETTETEAVTESETETASEEGYGEPLASGDCGASYEENGEEKTYDVKWAVYDSNADEDDTVNTGDVLVISGSGMMEDFSKDSTPPYSSYKASLKQVEVKSGVTSIGKYAFYQCSSLESIELPDSVTSIGNSTFWDVVVWRI